MPYDIHIGGAGYMLKPGAYQRFQDGAGESRVGRVRIFDFFGGGQRAAQLERDRFWQGQGAWPVFDSQGSFRVHRARMLSRTFPELPRTIHRPGPGQRSGMVSVTWHSRTGFIA